MRPKALCFLLMLIIVDLTYGESPAPEWGEVSKEELEMAFIPEDSAAEAVILFHAGYITPGVFIERRRVKVFAASGTQYADVSIPFFSGEEISGVEGYTVTKGGEKFLLDSTQVLTKKGRFLNETVFALPKVEEGCVFEYRYAKQTFITHLLGPWYFQNRIPTRLSTVTLYLKPWREYKYEFVNRGNAVTVPEVKEMSFGKTYTWTLQEVPAYKEEPYVACIDDYRTAIYFEGMYYEMAKNLVSTRFEKIDTWEKIGAWVDDLYEEVGGKRKPVSKKTRELTKELSADSEKAVKIYDYVRENIEWNGRRGIFSLEEKFLKTVLSHSEGSGTEKNLLLVWMLREAGLQAHPVLIRTRSYGKINKDNPSLSNFNHLIVLAKVEEQEFWLDGVDRLYPFGMLPAGDLVPCGLLIDGTESRIIELPPAEVVGKKHFTAKGEILEDGRLECSVEVSYQGYHNVVAREQFEEQGKEEFRNNEVLSSFPVATTDSLTYVNLDSADQPLKMRFRLSAPQYAQVVGEDVYVNPVLFTHAESNPFQNESRKYPIDFPYPETRIEETELLIPDGFELKELPSNVYEVIPGAAFSKTFSVEGSLIKCLRQMDVTEIVFPVGKYQALRSFFQEVLRADQQPVIVAKKQN